MVIAADAAGRVEITDELAMEDGMEDGIDGPTPSAPRRRLPKAERRAQLLESARELIRTDGTDQLTLGRLADRAGVTKPVVYDHFGDRTGVLTELYREFESHQQQELRTALRRSRSDLPSIARLIAGAHLSCCLAEGRELADVVDALSGSSALTRVRQEGEDAYLAICRQTLEPVVGPVDDAALHAIIGAGDALARRALDGDVSSGRAVTLLAGMICAAVTPGPPLTRKDEAS